MSVEVFIDKDDRYWAKHKIGRSSYTVRCSQHCVGEYFIWTVSKDMKLEESGETATMDQAKIAAIKTLPRDSATEPAPPRPMHTNGDDCA